ncbi:hypothetical protein A2U01_0109714, partial [Trifolium medium]|nr:hypothetical protein [Trifolium medium]
KKETETQGKNLRIVDRQSDINEGKISEIAGTKAGTMEGLTNNHGTAAKEPTGQRRSTHV